MSGIGLTRRQSELLAFIGRHVAENGYPPTYRTMMAALGIKSTSIVHMRVAALIERGRLRWHFGSLDVLIPAEPRHLRIVYGPGHWEDRARIKRAEYEREAA